MDWQDFLRNTAQTAITQRVSPPVQVVGGVPFVEGQPTDGLNTTAKMNVPMMVMGVGALLLVVFMLRK